MSTHEDTLTSLTDHDARMEHQVAALKRERWNLINEARVAGATWEEIGQSMGVTKQTAHEIWTTSTEAVMGAVRASNAAARRK